MPNKDGKGPRKRSRYVSRRKGGRRLGNCTSDGEGFIDYLMS